MSRFDDWSRKARAVLSAGSQVDRTHPALRELADELERQGIDEACTTLRAAATLLEKARRELAEELSRARLTPATREVEFWKAGGQ